MASGHAGGGQEDISSYESSQVLEQAEEILESSSLEIFKSRLHEHLAVMVYQG